MTTPRDLIGLDFGGMTIKGGAIRKDGGEVLARGSRPFDPKAPATEIYARAASLVEELETSAGRDGGPIGVGCAGLFDRESGRVIASANMPNLVDTSLSGGISAALSGRQVVIENDANVAAFGEQWLGAGKDDADMILVTLGTGVGGGIVMADKLFIGPGGNAGEIGHTVIHQRPSGGFYDGPFHEELVCPCGSYGCLERLVSATAAMRRARSRGLSDHLPTLAAAAREGAGPEALLLHEIGRDLGMGLATLVTLFDVTLFAIGGGFGGALDVLEAGALEALEERRYGSSVARIRAASLGADAGWIGAARLTA